MLKHRILVVDDDETVRDYIRELLLRRGFTPEVAVGGLDAVAKFTRKSYDLIILDIRMPDMSGHEVLKKIKSTNPDTVVIMVSAYSSIPDAVRAIRDGAYDYLPKPFKERDFDLLLNRALSLSDLVQENRRLRAREENLPQFIGKSQSVERIREIISGVADSRITVLITGQSGTGKEVVSRLIHYASNRSAKPFVRINCAALPDTLLESELFGYEKGAFTGADKAKAGKFEVADGGTILLDEISETSPSFQAKLLRVIQEREFSRIGCNKTISVDIRIIATSNKDLQEQIKLGHFREDLYFRLNVVPIHIPPLCQRREDIPFLADYFLRKFALENNKKIDGFSREAMKVLRKQNYPGNARELQNIIERAVVFASSDMIEPGDLVINGENNSKAAIDDDPILDDNITLAEMEKKMILSYLKKTAGNRSETARILNVSVRTIRNKLLEYKEQGIYVSEDGIISYHTDKLPDDDDED